jgi:hypothetical protein
MARNPFNKDGQSFEPFKGNKIINTKTVRNIKINNQDFIISERNSKPDDKGNYNINETNHIHTDHAGTPLSEDPRSLIAISHSGLFITSDEKFGTCSCWFHPNNRSSYILLGQDGRRLPNGDRCSFCDFWITNFYILIGIMFIGVVLGLFTGVGFF